VLDGLFRVPVRLCRLDEELLSHARKVSKSRWFPRVSGCEEMVLLCWRLGGICRGSWIPFRCIGSARIECLLLRKKRQWDLLKSLFRGDGKTRLRDG